MTTATEAAATMRDENQARMLDHMIRHFIKTYEPEDRRERLDFEMELHRLVRAIYIEASKPYERILSAAVQHTSLHSIVLAKDLKP